MQYLHKERHAFTMLEVIFVIVILGIVSSIGAQIIAKVYENYIVQRAMYKANTKTELALQQIANRLRYAIPGTVGYRANTNPATPFFPITTPPGPNNNVLQWVSYDGDSFEAIGSNAGTAASRRPGWSGFCDIYSPATNANTIHTPGSNLALATAIIGNLGGNINQAAIFFPYENGTAHNIQNVSVPNATITLAGAPLARVYERYKLAWSSYALEVDANNDLILHYNFAPTNGVVINNEQQSLLLHNVSNFRFKGTEGSIRIKLCIQEPISAIAAENITSCKEKVVF